MGVLFCPQCQLEGKRSTVVETVGPTTCVYCPTFYDEQGRRHIHDTNQIVMTYRCNRGHNWTLTRVASCWCGWPEVGLPKPE